MDFTDLGDTNEAASSIMIKQLSHVHDENTIHFHKRNKKKVISYSFIPNPHPHPHPQHPIKHQQQKNLTNSLHSPHNCAEIAEVVTIG